MECSKNPTPQSQSHMYGQVERSGKDVNTDKQGRNAVSEIFHHPHVACSQAI
jgi:hypothetical protein